MQNSNMMANRDDITVLDVRGLPAPEPLDRALDALHGLPDGARLALLIHREPYPLYDILRSHGYRHEVSLQDDSYRIVIWRDVPCSAP